MVREWDLKFVWPKDGVKGKGGHRGFLGRLNDILTNRGPDIFLTKKSCSLPIKVDQWSNWDSYHNFSDHRREISNPLGASRSRGFMRYDPQTRRYKNWYISQDWMGNRVGLNDQEHYPRFTQEEGQRILRRLQRGQKIDPLRMGKDWNYQGPKRFENGHNWFWQDAHRDGENLRQGFPRQGPVNPNLLMSQNRPGELGNWIIEEI